MFRLGGMVQKGSVRHSGDTGRFRRHGLQEDAAGHLYRHIARFVPRGAGRGGGGQAGKSDGVFHATTILAKHDERYMPPEVARAIGKPGVEHHETDTLVQGQG